MPLILIGLVVVVCLSVAYGVVQTVVMRRRLLRLPPAPPTRCPTCDATEQVFGACGCWDGARDPLTGERPNGSFYYATCTRCGSRITRWDHDAAYVPADDEWRFVVERPGAK
jgi:hypothetical protein